MAKQATGNIGSDRFSFNSGYHDGASDVERSRAGRSVSPWRSLGKPHFNPVYEAGYWAGQRDVEDGTYAENSDLAWRMYRAGQEAGKAVRRQLRNARPSNWIVRV